MCFGSSNFSSQKQTRARVACLAKREQATTRAKTRCGGSSPFDFAQGQNDKPKGKVELHLGAEGLHWLGVGLHCRIGVDHVLLQELVVETVQGEFEAVGDA